MKRSTAPVTSILVIFVAAVLGACIWGGCGTGPAETRPHAGTAAVSSVKKAQGIEVTLRSEPRVAKTGGSFSLTLNVRNLSGKSRIFTLPSSQAYEFTASAEDGGAVWRWSNGVTFAQAITPMQMASGDSLVFKTAWDPARIAAGKYVIQGYFLGMKYLRPSIKVELTP